MLDNVREVTEEEKLKRAKKRAYEFLVQDIEYVGKQLEQNEHHKELIARMLHNAKTMWL